jgi:hypothetical protein
MNPAAAKSRTKDNEQGCDACHARLPSPSVLVGGGRDTIGNREVFDGHKPLNIRKIR